MKTILHLIETSGPGGAENVLMTVLGQLDRSKYRSFVCLLKAGWLSTQLTKRQWETIIIPQSRSLDLRWLWRAVRFIKSRDVNLLHAHEFAMNTYSSMLSFLADIPCIATVHGKNYYTEKWHRRAAYRFVSKHAKMVAVSENVKRFLVTEVAIEESNIVLIHNGVDASLYSASCETRVRTRKELGLREDQPVIGTIGNLYPVKGHTYLLQAAEIVTRQYPSATFLFAGRGKLLDQLQQQSADLGLAKNVIFLGFREDIRSLLAAMDIFVLPSLSEGLPLSLLEAMAANRPVVATTVGGIPEIVINRQTGLLVPPGDPAALADALLSLLSNPHISAWLVKSGREKIATEFSVQAMVEGYERLYTEALS